MHHDSRVRMNISSPRPISYDLSLTPQVSVGGVYAPPSETVDRRPQPVEAVEPGQRVRREQLEFSARRIAAAAADQAPSTADEAESAFTKRDLALVQRGPFGWIGVDSTPFLAQLAGQNATPRDPVAAGRNPTSFRLSPVDRYEEVQSWGRRVELMFVFDGMITAAAA